MELIDYIIIIIMIMLNLTEARKKLYYIYNALVIYQDLKLNLLQKF